MWYTGTSIVIRVEKNEISVLKKKVDNLPAYASTGLAGVSKVLVEELRIGALVHRDTGDLADSIHSVQMSPTNYDIWMLRRGVYLDRTKPHFVPMRGKKAKRRLRKWYIKHVGGTIPYGIWVSPSPWINASIRRARKRLPHTFRKYVRQGLKR